MAGKPIMKPSPCGVDGNISFSHFADDSSVFLFGVGSLFCIAASLLVVIKFSDAILAGAQVHRDLP